MQPPGAKVMVNITNRTVIRTIVWVILAVLGYKFIGRISHELILIFVSFFLALALNPVVSWMSRRLRLRSRVRATAAAYLLVVIFLVAFFALVTPPLIRQTRDFINQVPQTVQDFQSKDSSLSRTIKRYHLDQKLDQAAKDFTSHYSSFGTRLLDTGRRLVEALASFLAVLVLTFMMLVEGPAWLDLYFRSLPAAKREHQKILARRMYKSVSGFVNGQFILAAIAGLMAFAALEITGHILDVRTNAVALGGIVAVFGVIPLFGNPLAAIIVILISLLNSVDLALVMLAYFIIYFFVENHTLQPFLQSRLNELTPLTVFIAAIVGVGFGGILGAIVAIPAASAIKILAENHYQRRTAKAAS